MINGLSRRSPEFSTKAGTHRINGRRGKRRNGVFTSSLTIRELSVSFRRLITFEMATFGRRVLRRAVTTLLLCSAALVVAVLSLYLHTLWFRNRAQRLLDEITALQVGVSTFADARKLEDEYVDRMIVTSVGCLPAECQFYVRLQNAPFLTFNNCCRLLRKLGIRPSVVVAHVAVREGTIRFASVHVSYRTSHGHWLDASAKAIESFGLLDMAQDLGLQLHPSYAVEAGNVTTIDGGEFINAAHTPPATLDERRIVTDIRLSCLTRMPDCNTIADLMPESAATLESDRKWINENLSTLGPLRVQMYEGLRKKYGSPPWNAAKSF